jgi:hypothetical protein
MGGPGVLHALSFADNTKENKETRQDIQTSSQEQKMGLLEYDFEYKTLDRNVYFLLVIWPWL